MVALDLHFMNYQVPRFQLKIFFTVLVKKNVTYILEGEEINNIFIFGWTIPLNINCLPLNI